MPKTISPNRQPTEKNGLTEKLVALYDLNRSYIDAAEAFLTGSSGKAPGESPKESLSRQDIDRLYSHVYVLEHMAKLLYEEFLINKNEGVPERSEENFDHRKTQMQK